MYQPNNEPNYDPNAAAQQMVPNVMSDEMQNMKGVEMQQGVNINMPAAATDMGMTSKTIPTYAVDTSEPQFEIPDPIVRRSFFRKVFIILLIQNILVLPAIEFFVLSCSTETSNKVASIIGILGFCVYILMYIFSDSRRYAPFNVIGLLVVSFFHIITKAATIAQSDTHLVIIMQFVVIAEIIVVIIYSKQNRFKFTNINAIFIILIIATIYIAIFSTISIRVFPASGGLIFIVIYYVYDMQLMLSGHHGYNLQPDEYIFAAANIYADIPNLVYRFLKHAFWMHLVRLYTFLRECCFAQVC